MGGAGCGPAHRPGPYPLPARLLLAGRRLLLQPEHRVQDARGRLPPDHDLPAWPQAAAAEPVLVPAALQLGGYRLRAGAQRSLPQEGSRLDSAQGRRALTEADAGCLLPARRHGGARGRFLAAHHVPHERCREPKHLRGSGAAVLHALPAPGPHELSQQLQRRRPVLEYVVFLRAAAALPLRPGRHVEGGGHGNVFPRRRLPVFLGSVFHVGFLHAVGSRHAFRAAHAAKRRDACDHAAANQPLVGPLRNYGFYAPGEPAFHPEPFNLELQPQGDVAEQHADHPRVSQRSRRRRSGPHLLLPDEHHRAEHLRDDVR